MIAAGFDAHSASRKPIIIGDATTGPATAAAAATLPPSTVSTSHTFAAASAGQVSNSPLFEQLEPLAAVSARNNGSSPFGEEDDDVDVPPFMRH